MEKYEEKKEFSNFWAWSAIILVCLLLVGWGLFIHYTIAEQPRTWDFGQLPFTPGESEFSTHQPPDDQKTQQITPLPRPSPGTPAKEKQNQQQTNTAEPRK